MPCVACREEEVGAVYATVHATDDYLRWASSHCARTSATANSGLARPQVLAQFRNHSARLMAKGRGIIQSGYSLSITNTAVTQQQP